MSLGDSEPLAERNRFNSTFNHEDRPLRRPAPRPSRSPAHRDVERTPSSGGSSASPPFGGPSGYALAARRSLIPARTSPTETPSTNKNV